MCQPWHSTQKYTRFDIVPRRELFRIDLIAPLARPLDAQRRLPVILHLIASVFTASYQRANPNYLAGTTSHPCDTHDLNSRSVETESLHHQPPATH